MILLPIALAALFPTPERFFYAPEAGLTLEIALEQTTTLELVRLERRHGRGGDRGEFTESEHGSNSIESARVTFTDRILAVEERRTTRLRRAFGELVHETSKEHDAGRGQSGTTEQELRSPLSEEAVLLTWDPSSEAYAGVYEDLPESDFEELNGLEHHGGLAFLLPDGEVQPGAEWAVEAPALSRILAPSGELAWKASAVSGPVTFGPRTGPTALEESLTARYVERKGPLATIALEGTLVTKTTGEATHGELASLIHGRVENGEVRTYEFEGQLVWNLESGLPVRVTLEGEVRSRAWNNQESDTDEGTLTIDTVEEAEGTATVDLRFEIVEDD